MIGITLKQSWLIVICNVYDFFIEECVPSSVSCSIIWLSSNSSTYLFGKLIKYYCLWHHGYLHKAELAGFLLQKFPWIMVWLYTCLFVCVFTIFKKYVMNVVWVPIYATSLQYISLLHAFLSMKDGHFITIGLFLLGDIFFILKLAPCLASLVSEFWRLFYSFLINWSCIGCE